MPNIIDIATVFMKL